MTEPADRSVIAARVTALEQRVQALERHQRATESVIGQMHDLLRDLVDRNDPPKLVNP
jgi:uncharacterized protein YigA (DUF484 family)